MSRAALIALRTQTGRTHTHARTHVSAEICACVRTFCTSLCAFIPFRLPFARSAEPALQGQTSRCCRRRRSSNNNNKATAALHLTVQVESALDRRTAIYMGAFF